MENKAGSTNKTMSPTEMGKIINLSCYYSDRRFSLMSGPKRPMALKWTRPFIGD